MLPRSATAFDAAQRLLNLPPQIPGNSPQTFGSNFGEPQAEKETLAGLCGRVLDVAAPCTITHRIGRFSTFALCRDLLPFAALCCTKRARKGQRPRNASPRRRRSSIGKGQLAVNLSGWSRWPSSFQDGLAEQVTVALLLILSAMAHQRDVSLLSKPCEETQCELLPVVFDRPAA
jgi:hypothetical protein